MTRTVTEIVTYTCDWCGEKDIEPLEKFRISTARWGNDVLHRLQLVTEVLMSYSGTGPLHVCKRCVIAGMKEWIYKEEAIND